MAKGNFLLGTVRKKLGGMVFQRRFGEQIIRARATTIRNPQTEGQARQRSRMSAIIPVFRLLNGVLYARLRFNWSQYNGFVSRNLRAMRPENNGNSSFTYEVDFDRLVPPTPRAGIGAGQPVWMPIRVTQGTLKSLLFGINPTSQSPMSCQIGENGLQQSGANGSLSINPRVMVPFAAMNVLATQLTQLSPGFYVPPTGTGSIQVDAQPFAQALAFALFGNRRVHMGLLVVYGIDSLSVMQQAAYNELGDIRTGNAQVTTAGGAITSFQADLINSRGEKFNVRYYPSAATSIGNAVGIEFQTMTANFNAPTGVALIMTRREGGKLLTSTNDLLLDQDAQTAYETLFTEEVLERGITDFQRQQNNVDGLNLQLI